MSLSFLEETYASDFPLKTIGGATAAKTQKTMWSFVPQKGLFQIEILTYSLG